MFKYQDETVEWMKTREDDMTGPVQGGFLCHEMGLGKTRMMCRLIRQNLRPLTLVLTTKSTIGSWITELCRQSNFAFDVRRYNKDKTVIDETRSTVLVTTHHSILKKNAAWFAGRRFDRVVVDEIHVLRNPNGLLFKGVQDIPSPFRWGLTATPFQNRAKEIVTYMRFLGRTDPEEFKSCMMRRTRADVFAGGPKLVPTKHVYDFESVEERVLYEYVSGRIDETNAWIAANARRLPRHVQGQMLFLLQLRERQAAIHPQIVLDADKVWRQQMPAEVSAVIGSPDDVASWSGRSVTKFKHILEMVKADQRAKQSTMIVTHFQSELNLIRERLEAIGVTPAVLTGKTTSKARTALESINSEDPAAIHAALDPHLPDDVISIVSSFLYKPRVLLLQIAAGGVGLSLPWVHHVIHTSPDWNPFLEQQATFRALRATTPHDVRVTSLYFERTIDCTIQAKQATKFEESLKWTGDLPQTISEFISMPV
jgi:SNF2 family DNA or RNA helicase